MNTLLRHLRVLLQARPAPACVKPNESKIFLFGKDSFKLRRTRQVQGKGERKLFGRDESRPFSVTFSVPRFKVCSFGTSFFNLRHRLRIELIRTISDFSPGIQANFIRHFIRHRLYPPFIKNWCQVLSCELALILFINNEK